MKGRVWKIEERETEWGTKMYDVVIECEKVPDIKLGECEIKQSPEGVMK